MNQMAKVKVHKFYLFLKEAMPVLIFLMLIFFGAAILGFQEDNRQLLRDSKIAAENTEEIIKRQGKQVEDLKEDNSKQTQLITCLLIFHGQNIAVSQEAQEACQKTLENTSISNTSTAPNQKASQPTTLPQSPNSGKVKPNPPTGGKQPPQKKGVIQRVNQFVENLFNIGG